MAAPQIDTNLLSIFEGQVKPISISELDASISGSDVNNSNIIFEIIPATGPTGSLLAGEFQLDGAAVTEFSLQDILDGDVDFAHDRTNRTPQYTVIARNAVTGEESTPSTPTVTFFAINDPPVIDVNRLTIEENGIVTLNSTSGAPNLIAQDEAGESSPAELRFEILRLSNGTFQRTVGGTTTALGVGGTFTQAEVNAGQISFRHDGSETAPAYQLRLVDSGVPDDPTPKGVRSDAVIQFTPVNDPPVLELNTMTLTEGDIVPFTTQRNLRATDIDNNNETLEFTITNLSGGKFQKLIGETWTDIATPGGPSTPFTQNDVLLQRIRFVNEPATNAPPAYTVEVRDSPGAEPIRGQAIVNFTPINDRPVLQTLVPLSVVEGQEQPIPLTSANFNVTDEETLPEDLQYEVITPVTGGRFIFLDGGETATDFTQADINAGNVIAFVSDGSNTAPVFTLRVTDEGGLFIDINSGSAIDFDPVNDLPQVVRAQLTLGEGDVVQLSSADNLLTTDEETPPEQLVYNVVFNNPNPDPAKRDRFVVNGIESSTFNQAQVNAGLVTFIHGGSNNAPDLTLTVTDTAVGEEPANPPVTVDLDIEFTAENDAPIFATNALTISEGGTVVFNSGATPNLVTTDEESTAAELTYTIRSVANGQFQRLGGAEPVNLGVDDTFTQAEVNSQLIQFVHNGGEAEPDYELVVTDSGINGNSETAIPAERDLTLTFTRENDAPQIENNSLTVREGETVFLTNDDLSATDEEDNDAQLIFTVTAISNGRIERVSAVPGEPPVILAQPGGPFLDFTQDDVQRGLIRFVHFPADNTEPSYTIQVRDLSTPALTSAPSVADIDFIFENDLPQLQVFSLPITEDAIVTLDDTRLSVTDEESSDPAQVTYTVNADTLTGGRFILTADDSTVTTFTQAQINAGEIAFDHDGSNNAPTFSLTVSDGEGGTITVTESSDQGVAFTPVNDEPVVVRSTLTLAEEGTVTLTRADNLETTDEESAPAELTYTLTLVNLDETQPDRFEIDGEVITEPTVTFTQAQVDAGLVRFIRGGSDFAPQITGTVTDTFDPETETETVPVTFDIDFTGENDPPVVVRNTLTISEAQTVTLTPEDFLLTTDEETPPENLVYTISSVANGNFQRFDPLLGTPVGPIAQDETFTQAEVNSGAIRFVHDGGEEAPSYTLTVTDTVTPGGPATPTETTVVIPDGGFTKVNDDPTLTTNFLEISEEGTVTFSAANLAADDPDNPRGLLRFEISNVSGGTFFLDGEELLEGQTFGISAITFGQLTFVDDGDEVPPSYTVTIRDPLGGESSEEVSVESGRLVFNPINEAPRLVTNTFTITEGGILTLNSPEGEVNLVATDDETPLASTLIYSFSNVVGGQFFDIDGNALTDEAGNAIATVTQQQIDSAEVLFEHNGSETAPSFNITVSDTDADNPQSTEPIAANIAEFIRVNDAPTLGNRQFTITEDDILTLTTNNFSATDPDNSPSELAFLISDLVGGQFNLTQNGTITEAVTSFTLAQVVAGQVQFLDDGDEAPPTLNVSVSDGIAPPTVPVPVTTVLTPVNDPPTAVDDSGLGFTTGENTVFTTANVLANDSDVDGDDFAIVPFPGGTLTTAAGALVTLAETGDAFIYNPNSQFEDLAQGEQATDTFQYTISDGNGGTDSATVTVVINGVNDAPVAADDAGELFTTTEGVSLITGVLTINDEDADGDNLVITSVGGQSLAPGGFFISPSGATVTLNDGDTLTYTPAPTLVLQQGESFEEEITYTISDGRGGTDTAVVTIVVNGVNDAPIANPDGPFNVTENVPFTTPNLLTNDTDPDGDTLSITSVSSDSVTINGDGTLTFSSSGPDFDFLAAGATQEVTFDYTVSDGNGGTDTATVSLTVTGVNDAPDAVNDSGTGFITREDIAFTTTSVLLNDLDPDSGDTFSITGVNTTGTRGLVTNNGNGTFTYNPNGQFESLRQGQTATDSFSYTLTDGSGATDTATVTITLNGFDRTPATFFDYGQFLRFNNLNAVVPTNEFSGLPIAQFFDEQYYLSQNSDIRSGVNAGLISSGFDHFVFSGINEGRNPSILYNEAFYLANNPDVAQLKASGALPSGLVHFLVSGHREGRDPSQFFDQSDYLTNNPDVAAAVSNGFFQSAFEHYIELGADENRLPNLSLYDERYYLQNNPDIANLVSTGGAPNGFTHFVVSGQREGRDPSVVYDEASYLALNPDVAAAVRGGAFISGFQHYALLGRAEGRSVF